MKKTNNKGFSLVELIIVIAIMAVLIGVLAPQFIKYVERSRESTDLQNIEEFKTAVEAWVADSQGASGSATIAMTAGTSASITLDGPDALKSGVSQYGVTALSQKAKSSKWTAFTWTYDLSKYTWSCSPAANSASADYFYADGTAVSSK